MECHPFTYLFPSNIHYSNYLHSCTTSSLFCLKSILFSLIIAHFSNSNTFSQSFLYLSIPSLNLFCSYSLPFPLPRSCPHCVLDGNRNLRVENIPTEERELCGNRVEQVQYMRNVTLLSLTDSLFLCCDITFRVVTAESSLIFDHSAPQHYH